MSRADTDVGDTLLDVEAGGGYVAAARAKREAAKREKLLSEGWELSDVLAEEDRKKKEREERLKRSAHKPSRWGDGLSTFSNRVGGALGRGKENAKVCCVCCGTGGCGVAICCCVLIGSLVTFLIGWALAHKWELLAAA